MDNKTFEAILQKATTAALDAGCAEIQRALGVKNGDAAGVYFSGSGADAVRDALRGYMGLEIAYLADTSEDAPPATQSEAPGEARERACWAAAERVKCAVLHALEPLGFVDADDGEAPAMIWHPEARLSIDAVRLPLAGLVKHVHEDGQRIGRERLQAEICRLIRI